MSAAPRLVGVRLGWGGPLRFYEAGELELAAGEWVVVAGADGERAGVVAIAPRQLVEAEASPPVEGSVRRASPEDRARLARKGETAGSRLLRGLHALLPDQGG